MTHFLLGFRPICQGLRRSLQESFDPTKRIPLLLHKTEKSLHASVMAEALQKMQKENTTLRHMPCHVSLNTDTKTKQESCHSGRVVMSIKILYRWKLPQQNVYPCRKLERMPRLATLAPHAAVKFGHEEQSTNKNKQTVPNEESENIKGLPSKLLVIWPLVKIFCISSESSILGCFGSVHSSACSAQVVV